jgi:hypothetical protein
MNFRLLKVAPSAALRSNHSPFFRFSLKRLCQYSSMPDGSSVRIVWSVRNASGSWIAIRRQQLAVFAQGEARKHS